MKEKRKNLKEKEKKKRNAKTLKSYKMRPRQSNREDVEKKYTNLGRIADQLRVENRTY